MSAFRRRAVLRSISQASPIMALGGAFALYGPIPRRMACMTPGPSKLNRQGPAHFTGVASQTFRLTIDRVWCFACALPLHPASSETGMSITGGDAQKQIYSFLRWSKLCRHLPDFPQLHAPGHISRVHDAACRAGPIVCYILHVHRKDVQKQRGH